MNETLTLRVHPSNPRARQRVLTGDDDGPFEVVVPLRIKSIAAALDWLCPNGVPADALRQGEFYFLPSAPPSAIVGCTDKRHALDCASYESTDAGSTSSTRCYPASFSTSHKATRCAAIVRSGSTCFMGRRGVKTHDWVGRPRYLVRGAVEHAAHGTLVLPEHSRGAWYEVEPNRAHGPFPMRSASAYAD